MIDAYTIGITLALDDGVSEGLAAIRRDLALLDASMDTSVTRLQTLRNLASKIMVPDDPERTLGHGTVSPPVSSRAADEASSSEAEPAPIAQAPVPMLPVAKIPVSPSMAPVVAATPPASPAVTIGPIDAAPPRSTTIQSVQSSPPSFQSLAPIPLPVPAAMRESPAAPEVPSVPTVAPSIADRSINFNQIGATALAGADLPAVARTTAPADLPTQSPRSAPEPAAPIQPAGRLATEPTPAALSFAPSAPTSVRKNADQDLPRTSAAPNSPLRAPAPSAAAPPSSTTQTSSSVLASNASDAPATVYAEVHLDGTALGRWVIRHLEKQVIRPHAGATGFDPRMTPSWPGAPLGN
jgi:hypothetical protein